MVVLCMFLVMLGLLLLEVPIFVTLGISSVFALLVDGSVAMQIVAQRMITAVNSFSLLALPFFMMAGMFMERGGLTDKMVDFAASVVGWI